MFLSQGTTGGQRTNTTPTAQAQLPIDAATASNRSKIRVAVSGGGLRIQFAATNDATQASVTSKLFAPGVEYIERGPRQYFSVMGTGGTVDWSISTGEMQDQA